ncbi:MAG: sugar MFS transporter [Bacteroidota bacterium]
MTTASSSSRKSGGYFLPMLIISILFFIFGFVTWLNSILIPYLKVACELTNVQAFFVTSAFYMAYFVTAFPSSLILKKTGLKNGMMLGLLVMAAGSVLFIPAAATRTYWIFLTGLFIMGTGLSILQTASNPYVTIIGPIESAARRISILGICNKAAGAIAPLILAYYIFNDADAFIKSLEGLSLTEKTAQLDLLAQRVINPYIIMTGFLILMGLFVKFSPLPAIEEEQDANTGRKERKNIFAYPHLILGAIALFFYVGAEVIAGDTIIRYGQSLGIEMEKAKHFTSYTMISMVIGYLLGIALIPKIIDQRKFLLYSMIIGIILSLCAIFTTGTTSVMFVALLGFSNAIVWPAIWPLAIHNLGAHIRTGSAMLIMAIAGGAILPLLWGWNADHYSPQQGYWIVFACYLIILLYALRGYRITSWKKK